MCVNFAIINQLFPWNPMKSSSLLVISTIVHWLKLPTALETHPRSAVLAVGSLRVTLQIPVVRAARHKKHGRHHDEIGCIWCDVVSSIFVKTKLTKLSHCWWYPIMTPLYTQYYHYNPIMYIYLDCWLYNSFYFNNRSYIPSISDSILLLLLLVKKNTRKQPRRMILVWSDMIATIFR